MSFRQLRRNPANKLVVSAEIKLKRDALEQLPVTIGTDVVDADSVSITRMEESITNWSDLALMKNANGDLGWILADNSTKYFDQTAFTTFVNQVKQKKAIRRDKLFKAAKDFIALLPDVTVAMIDDSNWPT